MRAMVHILRALRWLPGVAAALILAACSTPPSAPAATTAAAPTTPPAGAKPTTAPAAPAEATFDGTLVFGAPISLTGSTAKEGALQRDGYDLWRDTYNKA